jgi:hypothetical protein
VRAPVIKTTGVFIGYSFNLSFVGGFLFPGDPLAYVGRAMEELNAL